MNHSCDYNGLMSSEKTSTIVELLQHRCSIRQYLPKPVPQDVLKTILEAGRLSPSGGNEQSWMFGVITDPALIAQIAGLAHRQLWIARAPLLIVLCTVVVADERGGRDIQCDRYPQLAAEIRGIDTRLYGALNQEEHQTKIAGTHMILAALEQGVGACWVSRFEVDRLARLLQLPEGILPSEILVMGFPAQPEKVIPKKRLEEIIFTNTFPQGCASAQV